MKKEDNYYTPTIEEFHVGFEFEFSGLDGHWKPYPFEKQIIFKNKEESGINNGLFTLEWVGNIFSESKLDLSQRLRVKYLDKEDIQSFGWVLKEEITRQQIYCFEKTINGDKYTLTLWEEVIPQIKIEVHDYYDIIHSVFIKNKSELKRLLKQLNIDGNSSN